MTRPQGSLRSPRASRDLSPRRMDLPAIKFTLKCMRILFPAILKSFPLRQRRRLLIGLGLSFLAGPVLAQISFLILTGAR